MTNDHALGNAGYAITGSGGGGSGGSYVFASLEELDSIIADWTAIHDAIEADGDGMMQAGFVGLTPAEDEMSRRQSSAVSDSLAQAIAHNKEMSTYAGSYIAKLVQARKQYATDDEGAADRFGRANEG